ncbi:TrkH family potassium uptake protein [Clostridium cellulovorans]|uniref:Potassium uptake protein, TrkH family n=1 Tax=Clostridium cellulovorans (strain ATCC 35296 / DSM 3052 / OCM 3 / 743B) TaxID=573061 RepID=D9SM21_CLOC7|nr:TrkH family potassium uptake protein [Clostridium cellulovorans]ADL51752.1 potassium uptake protein, TrkH family [Clostridium cellulovorans 743B]
MDLLKRKKVVMTPVQILSLGFALTILTGAVILTLPISSVNGTATNFIDSLFTATSAVCVTGLTTLDTASHWSYFGKTIIMFLIETGGLGFMSFTTLYALIIGRRISMRERMIMKEALNAESMAGIVRLVKYVIIFTVSVQIIGALLLMTQFIPDYGVGEGIYFGIFHSVSAFCNAGFDLTGASLIPYNNNPVVILTISALIIIGGLGFAIWMEIYNFKTMKKLSLHAKFAIAVTLILLILGMIMMYIFDFAINQAYKDMSLPTKILNAFFASVTPRTAGFFSVPTVTMSHAAIAITIILMFIGGSPGSTAGGLKTTTIGLLVMTVISMLRGREDTEIFKKRINKMQVYKAFTILFIAFGVIFIGTLLLSIAEGEKVVGGITMNLEHYLYEIVSAYGTVGLTLNLTPTLTAPGKIIVMFAMYIGRVGILTFIFSMLRRNKKDDYGLKYPEDKIVIG